MSWPKFIWYSMRTSRSIAAHLAHGELDDIVVGDIDRIDRNAWIGDVVIDRDLSPDVSLVRRIDLNDDFVRPSHPTGKNFHIENSAEKKLAPRGRLAVELDGELLASRASRSIDNEFPVNGMIRAYRSGRPSQTDGAVAQAPSTGNNLDDANIAVGRIVNTKERLDLGTGQHRFPDHSVGLDKEWCALSGIHHGDQVDEDSAAKTNDNEGRRSQDREEDIIRWLEPRPLLSHGEMARRGWNNMKTADCLVDHAEQTSSGRRPQERVIAERRSSRFTGVVS